MKHLGHIQTSAPTQAPGSVSSLSQLTRPFPVQMNRTPAPSIETQLENGRQMGGILERITTHSTESPGINPIQRTRRKGGNKKKMGGSNKKKGNRKQQKIKAKKLGMKKRKEKKISQTLRNLNTYQSNQKKVTREEAKKFVGRTRGKGVRGHRKGNKNKKMNSGTIESLKKFNESRNKKKGGKKKGGKKKN